MLGLWFWLIEEVDLLLLLLVLDWLGSEPVLLVEVSITKYDTTTEIAIERIRG